MTTPKNVMKMIKDNDVKYVDFRFTDPRGKWQHVTFDVTMIEEDTFAEGQMFDGSSIAGWKAINESDMCLMPDPAIACIDPFFAETTLSLVCDVLEPTTGEPYNRDPRGIAKKAEAHGQVDGRRRHRLLRSGSRVLRVRRREVSRRPLQHRLQARTRSNSRPTPTPSTRAAISATTSAPRRATSRCRRRTPRRTCARKCSAAMARMGCEVEKHHHEVASAQHELGLKFSPLTVMADRMQIYKYCIQQVAQIYGKTATFMPKPIYGDNGSGMHCHQSIWKGGKPVFAGNKYADLSDTCLSLHRRHHQARQGDQRLHQSDHQLLQAAGAGLRGAGAARLLGAQPLGVVPHPLHHQSEGQARRGPLPRSAVPIRISASPRC